MWTLAVGYMKIWMYGGAVAPPLPTGDHKGPPILTSSTLAPTVVDDVYWLTRNGHQLLGDFMFLQEFFKAIMGVDETAFHAALEYTITVGNRLENGLDSHLCSSSG